MLFFANLLGLWEPCAGESSALALLDAFRLPWSKLDGQQPLAPEHPQVLRTRPGIIVTSKVWGCSTRWLVSARRKGLKILKW